MLSTKICKNCKHCEYIAKIPGMTQYYCRGEGEGVNGFNTCEKFEGKYDNAEQNQHQALSQYCKRARSVLASQ